MNHNHKKVIKKMCTLSENKKVVGKEHRNCDKCWLDKKVFIIEDEHDNLGYLCHECFHKWRTERKLMPNNPIPAFNLLLNAFDMLQNTEKLETLLENLTENDREVLYTHPLLENYDLLP